MTNPEPAERVGTNWTEERCAELKQLEELLRECRQINHGSGVIERLQGIAAMAEKLSFSDMGSGRDAFAPFLRSLAIKDRTRELSTGQRD